MTFLTEFAPAKINLALHVLGRRADGFHEIDSIVAFADVGDELRLEPAAEFSIAASGPFAALLPPPERNIIGMAYRKVAPLAAARGKTLPPVAVHLTKNLPLAAGIGGGSADAAAAMRGFLRISGIAEIDDEISEAALSLGADVPVCLMGKACRMQGVGERITPLDHFKPWHAVLINPRIAVQTSEVFQKLGLTPGEKHCPPLSNLSEPTTWRNDLAVPAAAIAPVITDVIAALENQQRLRFARMSGSGATCFGIFENRDAAGRAARQLSAAFPNWWVRHTVLR